MPTGGSCPNAVAPFWFYLPLCLWCVRTHQPNWIVGPAFCFIVPRCLCCIQPSPGHRNLCNSLTLLGGINARIICTFFFCGLIPSWNNTYPMYSVSVALNDNVHALTFSHASHNLIKTLFSLLRWSSSNFLENHRLGVTRSHSRVLGDKEIFLN